MITINEMTAILEKAKTVLTKTKNVYLDYEVKQLAREMKTYQQSNGIQKELSELSCAYYTNEVRNSLQLLGN